MGIIEETKTIKVKQYSNYICPYCHRVVDPNDGNAMMVKPKGSKVKQWQHVSCWRFDNGFY